MHSHLHSFSRPYHLSASHFTCSLTPHFSVSGAILVSISFCTPPWHNKHSLNNSLPVHIHVCCATYMSMSLVHMTGLWGYYCSLYLCFNIHTYFHYSPRNTYDLPVTDCSLPLCSHVYTELSPSTHAHSFTLYSCSNLYDFAKMTVCSLSL